jgi:hypothetical protein
MARSRSALRNAQLWAVDTLKRPWHPDPAQRIPGIILAWDMGAGKSGVVLTAVRDLLDQCVIRKVLIVSTVLVVQTTWPDEIEKWEHTKALTWTLIRVEDDDLDTAAAGQQAYAAALLRYQKEFEQAVRDERALGSRPGGAKKNAKQRIGATPSARAEADREAAVASAKEAKLGRLAGEDTEIHLINKQALPWLWDHFGDGKRWPYDLIVLDDVREAKSGKKRSRGTKKDAPKAKAPLSRFGILARARKHVDSIIQLTGTPTPKGLQNLWGQAYLADLGERLGTGKTAFEKRWFNFDRYSYEVTPKDHAEGEITAKLKDIMFSLDPADYPELPPTFPNIVKVRLPGPVLKEYKRFERDMVSETYDVEAVNSGVLHGKLLQFANGSMYQEDGNDIEIHDLKLQALERIVEETGGEPLLIAYSYLFDLARIRKKFPKAVVFNESTNPRKTIRDWNDGKIGQLLCHPASAAHGVDGLQIGGHIGVWYGLTSDLELYLQFNKRLSRPGQTKTVWLHHIVAEGTIDEDILPLYLEPKSLTQDRIMRAVMVRIQTRYISDELI